MQFLILKQKNEKLFFAVAVKNNFNMPACEKKRKRVRYILEIKNFTNAVLEYFLASTFTNRAFQYSEY